MSKENRDKPAFPARVKAMGYSEGLTKREWIATQLLAGIVSDSNVRVTKSLIESSINTADELLKQLEETK